MLNKLLHLHVWGKTHILRAVVCLFDNHILVSLFILLMQTIYMERTVTVEDLKIRKK